MPRVGQRFRKSLRVAALVVLIAPAAVAQGTPPEAAPTAAAEPRLGAYESRLLNGKKLPVTDRASDDEGTQYLIEFDELILSLRPSHEFRASLRYRQTLAARGKAITQDPLQRMTVYGTWSVAAGALRFIPDPNRGGKGLRILNGTFNGNTIDVPFDYRNGTVTHRANVSLLFNPKII